MYTLLDYAIICGNVDIIRIILDARDVECMPTIVRWKLALLSMEILTLLDIFYELPLCRILSDGNCKLAKHIIQTCQICVNTKLDNGEGCLPLFCAVSSNNYELVQFMLDCGADPNKTKRSHDPLTMIMSNQLIDYEIFKLLVKYGYILSLYTIKSYNESIVDDNFVDTGHHVFSSTPPYKMCSQPNIAKIIDASHELYFDRYIKPLIYLLKQRKINIYCIHFLIQFIKCENMPLNHEIIDSMIWQFI